MQSVWSFSVIETTTSADVREMALVRCARAASEVRPRSRVATGTHEQELRVA